MHCHKLPCTHYLLLIKKCVYSFLLLSLNWFYILRWLNMVNSFSHRVKFHGFLPKFILIPWCLGSQLRPQSDLHIFTKLCHHTGCPNVWTFNFSNFSLRTDACDANPVPNFLYECTGSVIDSCEHVFMVGCLSLHPCSTNMQFGHWIILLDWCTILLFLDIWSEEKVSEWLFPTFRGRQWTGEYVLNFHDLMVSSGPEAVSGTEEARFSFIKGGYMEDIQPEGIFNVF